jgi:pyruvate/2-oxoglutarate dehydrogenase complex dihydrolipoamide dehydrogenase (E3) component
LPREDADAAHAVANAFEAEGVTVHNDATITSIAYDNGEFTVTATVKGATHTLTGDQVLVATGRTPNIETLQLNAASIAATKHGITVNDRLQTSNKRVYAIGDVSSTLQFTHVADAHARLAVPNALFFGIGGGTASSLIIPRVTYTSPEVAHVGVSPHDAHERGIAIDTIHIDLAQNDRARLDGNTNGFLAVHLKKGTDKILGGTLVAEHAGEMISELTVAIKNGIGLGALGGTIHPYPTQSEVYRRAADTWRRGRLTPLAKRAFRAWFRIFS